MEQSLIIRRANALDLTLLLSTMAMWGLAFVAMKIVVPAFGPYWLATYRNGLGAIFVTVISVAFGFRFTLDRDTFIKVVIVAIFMFVIPQVLICLALQSLDAGMTALLMGMGPFLALIAGHFVTKDERFSLRKLIGVLMGFFAISLIVGVEAVQNFGSGSFTAQLALLAASACYVTGGFTIRRIKLPFLPQTAICLFLGTALLVPVSLFFDGPPPLVLSRSAWVWMLFLGFIGSGLGFISRFYLIQRIGYSMFSLGVNFIPVSGVFMGALVLGETVTATTVLALIFVLGGVFVARSGSGVSAS